MLCTQHRQCLFIGCAIKSASAVTFFVRASKRLLKLTFHTCQLTCLSKTLLNGCVYLNLHT